jgi:hypothetical protein
MINGSIDSVDGQGWFYRLKAQAGHAALHYEDRPLHLEASRIANVMPGQPSIYSPLPFNDGRVDHSCHSFFNRSQLEMHILFERYAGIKGFAAGGHPDPAGHRTAEGSYC